MSDNSKKFNNFKGFDGFTTIKVRKSSFTFKTSELPVIPVVLSVVTASPLPAPAVKVSRHKDAAKAAKLCGIRAGNPTHKLVSEGLKTLKNQGVLEQPTKFGFKAANAKLAESLKKKVEAEITKLTAELKDSTVKAAKSAGTKTRICGKCGKSGHNVRTCGRPVVAKPKGKRGRPVGSKNKPKLSLEQVTTFLNEKGIDLDKLAALCAVADKLVDFFGDAEVVETLDTSDTDALINGLVADIKAKHSDEKAA